MKTYSEQWKEFYKKKGNNLTSDDLIEFMNQVNKSRSWYLKVSIWLMRFKPYKRFIYWLAARGVSKKDTKGSRT